MTENVLNMVKYIHLQIQKVQWNPSRIILCIVLLGYHYVSKFIIGLLLCIYTKSIWQNEIIIIKQLEKIIIINLTEWSKNNYKATRRKDILYIIVV